MNAKSPLASLRRIAALVLISATTVAAQQIVPPAPDTSHGPQTLFVRRDAWMALGFAGLTVAMFPLDKSVARHINHADATGNSILGFSATTVENIADPGSVIIGPALYLYGRLSNHPDIEDLGWHGTEAVILGGSITWMLKGLAGRSRPFVSNDTNPHDFKFGKGFTNSDRASFPSGHTTVAFAAASSVTSEAQRIWPGHNWLVAPVLYGGASLVGLARMYHNKHWASDVALGAAVGTFSGLKVVRYAHAHPKNFIDRRILSLSAEPIGPSAVALTISLSP
ncbi:MAG: phosphatase PAP2 family protein [Gemmatimonadaceae bacterium]